MRPQKQKNTQPERLVPLAILAIGIIVTVVMVTRGDRRLVKMMKN